jgi:heat shock transcription factor
MVDARAAATLDEWLATATGDEEMDLLYYEPMGAESFIWSPFYIQVPSTTCLIDPSLALLGEIG